MHIDSWDVMDAVLAIGITAAAIGVFVFLVCMG